MAALVNLEDGLQERVFATLRTSAAVTAKVGPRIFDRVPDAPPPNAPQQRAIFPHIVIGEDELNDDSDGCGVAFEAIVTVHVFSRAVGKAEAKTIGAAVRAALDAQLEISGVACRDDDSHFRSARYFTEPDGLTTHGVLTFRYVFDVAA